MPRYTERLQLAIIADVDFPIDAQNEYDAMAAATDLVQAVAPLGTLVEAYRSRGGTVVDAEITDEIVMPSPASIS